MQSVRRKVLLGLGSLLAVAASGCTSGGPPAGGRRPPEFLTLFAFNYSDRYIHTVWVDGRWMGNVSAYTNGGSVMGPRAPKPRDFAPGETRYLRVVWELGNRYDLKTNRYEQGQKTLERHEAMVLLKVPTPFPPAPSTILLHFYQDGHVEAELLDASQNKFDMRREPVPAAHREAKHYN